MTPNIIYYIIIECILFPQQNIVTEKPMHENKEKLLWWGGKELRLLPRVP